MDAPCTSDGADIAARIGDVARVRALLIEAAEASESVSYAALLARLGTRFTRPRMRALCRTLDRIDQDAAAADEPELAVLVVRESDGLPGQGWWAGGHAMLLAHEGDWTGPEARALVARLQSDAFRFWRNRRRG